MQHFDQRPHWGSTDPYLIVSLLCHVWCDGGMCCLWRVCIFHQKMHVYLIFNSIDYLLTLKPVTKLAEIGSCLNWGSVIRFTLKDYTKLHHLQSPLCNRLHVSSQFTMYSSQGCNFYAKIFGKNSTLLISIAQNTIIPRAFLKIGANASTVYCQ